MIRDKYLDYCETVLLQCILTYNGLEIKAEYYLLKYQKAYFKE